MKTLAIVLFILMYVLMIVFSKRRPFIAAGFAVLFAVLGITAPQNILGAINWNVLMMIAGTMVVVDSFIESRMPERLADFLLDRSKNVMWVTILLSLFAGFVSAFIDNVATVLMIAPVGIAICKKLKITPVPVILCIAVSSNLQGAATLVGDTTAIMLGAYANMDFTDFFWMNDRPGMFFATELGALVTVPVMMLLFRNLKKPVQANVRTQVSDYVPSFLLTGVVLSLIGASFLPDKPDVTNGLICMAFALITVVYKAVRGKDGKVFGTALRSLDYETLLLLAGLFIVIEGITEVGLIRDIAEWIARVGGNNLFVLFTIIVWGSVAVSAFVDNIPYVATMLPVISGVTAALGIEPYLLYFGLLVGATLGGNITPIGASANITAIGILRKEGEEVGFGDFMRIGVPFTLAAVLSGYLFLWIFWR